MVLCLRSWSFTLKNALGVDRMDKKIREKIMRLCKRNHYYCEFILNTNSFIVRIKPSELVNPRYILSAITDELLSLGFYVSSIFYEKDELEIIFHEFSLKRLEKG